MRNAECAMRNRTIALLRNNLNLIFISFISTYAVPYRNSYNFDTSARRWDPSCNPRAHTIPNWRPLCTPLPLCRVYYTLISYVYTYNDRLLHVDDVAIQCRLMKSPGHGVHCHHVTHFIISGSCDWVWRGCRDCDFATRFGSEEIHSEHKYCTGKRAHCRSSCPKESADRSM